MNSQSKEVLELREEYIKWLDYAALAGEKISRDGGLKRLEALEGIPVNRRWWKFWAGRAETKARWAALKVEGLARRARIVEERKIHAN